MAFDQTVALRVGFEMIDGFDERDAGCFGDLLRNTVTKLGMRVDAGSNRRAASG